MDAIVQWFSQIYSFMAVIPFIVFIILWGILYGITKDKKRATRTSMDVTAVLLIGSVSMMIKQIFGTSFGFWFLLLFFLVCAGLLGNLQNRTKGAVDLAKIAKVLLRLGFMLLSVCYILLLVIGVGKYVYIS
ncbi:DUF3397 domain-containing protein [Paenibacillus thalictri]|uniref:DUF3397 domain-containing protein n=1 Tax=Paenibacillus thalictri TaxID=2527873 RepID=A0A4Q9DPA8_9BACL|nr:DUF3397 domain-containing protein [Paenibacillus thalictri]TBL78135.1 DUF3397 domain-containing protein [Paenibacillus thalictri]